MKSSTFIALIVVCMFGLCYGFYKTLPDPQYKNGQNSYVSAVEHYHDGITNLYTTRATVHVGANYAYWTEGEMETFISGSFKVVSIKYKMHTGLLNAK